MLFTVCFFISCLRLSHAVLDVPQSVRRYQIVEPIQVTPFRNKRLYKRDLSTLDHKQDGNHMSKVEYLLRLKNETLHLDLIQNKYLLGYNFNVKLQSNSTHSVKFPVQNCHYHGKLRNRPGRVVLSTCNGLTGTVFDDNDGTQYYIHYLEGSKKHIIYRPEDMRGTPDKKYHVNNRKDMLRVSSAGAHKRFRRHLRKDQDSSVTKYISFAIVADNAFLKQRKGDVQSAVNYIMTLANHMDHMFKPANVRIALTNVEIWDKKDMFYITSNAGLSLNMFSIYNKGVLTQQYKWKHSNAHLLTGVRMLGSLVGLGNTGTLCYGTSEAISHSWSDNPALTAGTVAHELGHNFGIFHYGKECKCQQPPCLMAPYASWSAVQGLADCTLKKITKRCMNGYCSCLMDKPNKIYGGPTCGNGYVEQNEECDCGMAKHCNNRCCNPMTCKLNPGAKCAHGECCENCKLKAKGTLCRLSVGECDLDDKCDGRNPQCPKNIYLEDYTSCNADKGYCHNSLCSESVDQQCVHMWGPGAKGGDEKCKMGKRYINMDGSKWGHCGQKDDFSFIKCKERDVHCGKLQCYGDGLPNFVIYGHTRTTMFYNGDEKKCRTGITHLGNDLTDPTVTRTGTRCGHLKVCHEQQCIETSALKEAISKCHNKCGAHGRCTNAGACYCSPAYKCPNCVGFDYKNYAGKLCESPPVLLTTSKRRGCACKNGGVCTSDGACVCKPGYKCPDCQDVDPSNKKGKLCDPILIQSSGLTQMCKIKCQKGGICNPFTNTCYCPPGSRCPGCNGKDKSNLHGKLCYPKGYNKKDVIDIKCQKFSGSLQAIGCKGGYLKNHFDMLMGLRNQIVWGTKGYNMEELLCECITTAAQKGYQFAGLQYWGECWATKEYEGVQGLSASTDCTTYNYSSCDGSKLCAGKNSLFLYAVLQ